MRFQNSASCSKDSAVSCFVDTETFSFSVATRNNLRASVDGMLLLARASTRTSAEAFDMSFIILLLNEEESINFEPTGPLTQWLGLALLMRLWSPEGNCKILAGSEKHKKTQPILPKFARCRRKYLRQQKNDINDTIVKLGWRARRRIFWRLLLCLRKRCADVSYGKEREIFQKNFLNFF